MKVPKDYLKIQGTRSFPSRGTTWGARTRNAIKRYLGYFQGQILEVGCGDGYGLETLFLLKAYHAVGVDIDEDKLGVAKVHGMVASFGFQEDLPFGDKSFDTLYSSHTLEHSYDREKAISEYQRVAKRAIIIVPIEPKTKHPKVHLSAFNSSEELFDLLKSRGKIILEEPLDRIEMEHAVIIDFK